MKKNQLNHTKEHSQSCSGNWPDLVWKNWKEKWEWSKTSIWERVADWVGAEWAGRGDAVERVVKTSSVRLLHITLMILYYRVSMKYDRVWYDVICFYTPLCTLQFWGFELLMFRMSGPDSLPSYHVWFF